MKDTMKTQNRLWITLIAFGLFAIIFCRWIYVKDTVRETLSFNETVHLETLQSFESEIKTERIVLPRLIERLQREANDVQYRLTLSESPCLRGI